MLVLLLSLPGLLIAAAGGFWMNSRARLWREGIKATGRVVRIAEHQGTERTDNGRDRAYTSYYPVVEFTSQEGEKIEFEGATGSSSTSLPVGTEVAVLYPAGNPQSAAINNFEQLWLGPVVILGFGLVFMLAGLGAGLMSRQ